MDLSLIFNVPGKPGLYKLISQGKNSAIMESLADKKRAPFFGLDKMSSLAEIAIYTEAEEMPLADVFRAIHKKENGGACLGHKEDAKTVRDYFAVVLPPTTAKESTNRISARCCNGITSCRKKVWWIRNFPNAKRRARKP